METVRTFAASPAGGAKAPSPGDLRGDLRKAAVALEATFLAEMLKAAGAGTPRAGFGGGPGEEQFGSFLVREQAQAIAEAGGIGLAEAIFNSLAGRADAAR